MLILLNFAENYCFVVQDAVQGCHWNNSQATLYPFVAYCLNCNTLVSNFFCAISDKMKHDTTAVHKFMSCVTLPQIKRIWSNAITLAVVQALNIKITRTLTTFAITKLTLKWMLSGILLLLVMERPCDGIGDTLKRPVASASLQMVSGETITSSNEMFKGVLQRNIKHFLIKAI